MAAPPELTGVQFNAAGGGVFGTTKPLLVLGPSLGTSAITLWGACAGLLTERFHVIGWDLPGHGSSPAAKQYFDIPALASSVLALVDSVLNDRGERGGTFVYAGDSVGGAVGLQLLLDYPGRITAAATVCSGAQIGDPEAWLERAEMVRAAGTPGLVTGSAARWFAAGFVERRLSVASALLQALQDTERFSYAWICEALSTFDVRNRLGEITVPVLAVAGSDDIVTPPEYSREIAAGVVNGRVTVVDGVAHLAPAESPAEIAVLLAELAEQPELAGNQARDESAGFGTPGFGTEEFRTRDAGSARYGTDGYGTGEAASAGYGTDEYGTTEAGPAGYGTEEYGTTQATAASFGTEEYGTTQAGPAGYGTEDYRTMAGTEDFRTAEAQPAEYETGEFRPTGPRAAGFDTGGFATAEFGAAAAFRSLKQVHDDGMKVRREVLGDAHVDRAIAASTDFTADFQELITGYAWGSIWTRPGLDRRSRSMITLTALVAQGHHEELAMHVRAARTNGLTRDEIKEVLLQTAIYCGVPAANTAFRIAQEVLNRMDAEAQERRPGPGQ